MEQTQAGDPSRFDSRAAFAAQVRAVMNRSHLTLQLFDPDFSVWPLGQADVDARLRAFLVDGGAIALALHRPGHIERECPRFMRLLRDFGHCIECRATPPGLQQLTDSFIIGDGVHIAGAFIAITCAAKRASTIRRRWRSAPNGLPHCGWNRGRRWQ